MRDVVLVIEQKGAALTVAALDRGARILAQETPAFGIERPLPECVEADAHEVWQVARDGIGGVLRVVDPDVIAAVAVVTEPGNALLWEQEHSRPVTPIVMPEDRRAEAVCRSFRERGWDEAFRRRTGRLPDAVAAGFKVSSLLDGLARGHSLAADGDLRFGTLDSFFLLRLTGSRVHATSRTHAVHTLLYSIEQDGWDVELLQAFNVPRACLPHIQAPASLFGETTLGGRLPGPVPVAAMGTRAEMALFGGVGARPGATLVTLDDPVSVLSFAGADRVHPALPLNETLAVTEDEEPRIALHATAADRLARWCVHLDLARDDAEALRLAGDVADPAGAVFIPGPIEEDDPAALVEAHFRNGDGAASPARLARAVFETAAFRAHDLLAAVEGQLKPEPLAVCGAFTRLPGLAQRLADLIGRPVYLLPEHDSALRGAARLAAHTAGLEGEHRAGTDSPDARLLEPRHDAGARLAVWRDVARS